MLLAVVTVASSGLEALDVLRKHAQGTFHLILTVRRGKTFLASKVWLESAVILK